MPLPSVTFRSELDPIVRKELDQFDGELTGYLLKEHNDDGEHTNITAKSLTVSGGTTLTGPVTITGPITGSGIGPHAPTHNQGGTDPVTVTSLAGYPGGTAAFLRADGTFAAPAAGVPAAHHASHETGGTDALVALSGGVITTGTVADARLSTNVPLKNGANAFTNTNSFALGVLERSRSVPMGEWQAIAFNAANFNGAGVTWSVTAGGVGANRYTLIGKTLIWNLSIDTSTFSGTANYYVLCTMPFVAAANGTGSVGFCSAGGVVQNVYAYWFAAQNFVYVTPRVSANFPLGTFILKFTLTIELQ